MKKLALLFLFLFIISCNEDEKKESFYKAINSKSNDTAYLKISEIENQFIGKYLVIYKDKTFDLGNISGEIIGDTLKGRNKYNSRRNSKFIKPFVLLKENNQMKLGTGMVSYYSQIPFFANGTIQFPDTLFQFYLLNSNEIQKLNKKFNF